LVGIVIDVVVVAEEESACVVPTELDDDVVAKATPNNTANITKCELISDVQREKR
jgi:hypothetical protein